jgi:hypothetical protein
MKKIQYMVAGLLLFCGASVFAQDNGLTLKINYGAGVPVGSFKDVIRNTSYRGFGAELMYHINKSVAAGLETGSQDFYQKYPRQLYKAGDGSDISAVLSNSIQAVPIMLKGQYNFLAGGAVQPYVALAAGGNIIRFNQYAGEFSNDGKTKFGFAARPEAGVYIPFGRYKRAGFSLGAGYNFMPFNYAGIGNLNNISVRAGISFPLD